MNKEIVGYDSKKLLGMGFVMDKPDLWKKDIVGVGVGYWDFRKLKKGRFYVSNSNGFLDDEAAKALDEYRVYRADNKDDTSLDVGQNVSSKDIVLRGNESSIINVVKSRRLDIIKQCSKDKSKPGESILYYDIPKIGLEPSVELIDMICADMGSIEVSIIDKGINRHIDESSGDMFLAYFAVVKARDLVSGAEGLGSAEEIIDFDEMKNQGRSFALTKAIRKAERNAKERLIPVPRKALVQLVINLLKDN